MIEKIESIPRNANNIIENSLYKINKELPQNVCVHLYGITAFPILLEKLSSFWTEIRMPKRDSEDSVPWIIAYAEYLYDNETHYLFYVFQDGELDVIEEINNILEGEISES